MSSPLLANQITSEIAATCEPQASLPPPNTFIHGRMQPEELTNEELTNEVVEGHTEKVMTLIQDALKAHEERVAQEHNKPLRSLQQPVAEIDRHLVEPAGLNPRGIMLAAMYYVNTGNLERGIGYLHLALLRAKADMNCCAVADTNVWKYMKTISAYAERVMALRLQTGAAALHYLHGWDVDKLVSKDSANWEDALLKRAHAFAVEHDQSISWTYDRRWCLLCCSTVMKGNHAVIEVDHSGLRSNMEKMMTMDFDFGGERDRYFQEWNRKMFMSNVGVGPKMSAAEKWHFAQIQKASVQGKKQLPRSVTASCCLNVWQATASCLFFLFC